ncbi:MAG: energy transducer TonB [Tunicatimonas sp.]
MEPKKNPSFDQERKRNFHFVIGLILSLATITVAFEWRTRVEPIDLPPPVSFEETILPPIPTTVHEPPKPKLVQPEIIHVPDDEDVDIDVDIIIDVQLTDDDLDEYLTVVNPPDEPVDDIFITVETQPSFPGGISAFYQYLGESVVYPKQAIRQSVSGKVFVEFVVDKDGSLSQIKVLKGIGAGCDEEALRVIKNSPRWNPGKQRGRAVRVRMVVPISFKLQ